MTAKLVLRTDDAGHAFDLADFDLNLLLVLNALLRCRNITRAGSEVGLSQPATSRALTRLREMFGDELLVRRNRAFELTELAEMLAPKVAAALENIGEIFSEHIPGPERFAVAMPDYLALLLVGNLTGYFREVSPSTVFLPVIGSRNILSQLEAGSLDIALGLAEDAPAGFYCRKLPAVPAVALVREGHPAGEGALSWQDLGRFLSIRIGSGANAGFGEVHDGLEALRPQAGETLSVPDIHTAAQLVQDTDAVLVLPGPSARYLASRYSLRALAPPGEVAAPGYQVSLIWHERWHRSSIHAGVRSMIASYVLEGA
ncbi:LysR family transcriptional regulator [Breoghania sp. JC706]|uniref:LysR family transcriptional regulator n=1 Tax=Breoghania sp. JC706 TaxID=3117732 RepID=UPI00300B3B90